MASELTRKWRELFKKNCTTWDDREKLRYLNIPNDPDDIDDDELNAARELILEVNKRPPIE